MRWVPVRFLAKIAVPFLFAEGSAFTHNEHASPLRERSRRRVENRCLGGLLLVGSYNSSKVHFHCLSAMEWMGHAMEKL